MASATANEAGHGTTWIVSPSWDLTYLVATPLIIVPAVLATLRSGLTPEQISLAVIAFASLGHHLPGFMRAYGDRHLFQRFRWRFLLMPPLVFFLALVFSPPAPLRSALGLPWTHLGGLELLLLLWGTWHGLMQTYGFMRIYDIKRGVNDAITARLDHLLCLVIFTAGFVFSDARVFGLADMMWQIGLPTFGRDVLIAVRAFVGAATIAVILAYVAHAVRQARSPQGVAWNKLLLATTTGWLYWYTGRISTNVLIGLAMFEIFHAIQYYAIVWTYNRRLFDRAGSRFGFLGFMFRDRYSMLGLYLALIGAYGSIRYFSVDVHDYVFRGGSADAHKLLIALFVTSTFLHFYYDGFIWKVSERDTQRNLVDDDRLVSRAAYVVPGLVHAGKCALFFVPALLLLYVESSRGMRTADESQLSTALAKLTPDLPECQTLVSREALRSGDIPTAIAAAEKALQLRPHSHTARADLGLALIDAGDFQRARHLWEEAASMAPRQWRYHSNLGLVCDELGDTEAAEEAYHSAIAASPTAVSPRMKLAAHYLRRGLPENALRQYQQVLQWQANHLDAHVGAIAALSATGEHQQAVAEARRLRSQWPDDPRVQLALGGSLVAAGEYQAAIDVLDDATLPSRPSADRLVQLAIARLHTGQVDAALPPLQQAVSAAPNHIDANFQLGIVHYQRHAYSEAEKAFRRVLVLAPQHAESYLNLGAALVGQQRLDEAERAYRTAIELRPQDATAHFNLGTLLWRRGWPNEGRRAIEEAARLGYEVPDDVQGALEAAP